MHRMKFCHFIRVPLCGRPIVTSLSVCLFVRLSVRELLFWTLAQSVSNLIHKKRVSMVCTKVVSRYRVRSSQNYVKHPCSDYIFSPICLQTKSQSVIEQRMCSDFEYSFYVKGQGQIPCKNMFKSSGLSS